eukprot:4222557-Amphidinium_carterae.1
MLQEAGYTEVRVLYLHDTEAAFDATSSAGHAKLQYLYGGGNFGVARVNAMLDKLKQKPGPKRALSPNRRQQPANSNDSNNSSQQRQQHKAEQPSTALGPALRTARTCGHPHVSSRTGHT